MDNKHIYRLISVKDKIGDLIINLIAGNLGDIHPDSLKELQTIRDELETWIFDEVRSDMIKHPEGYL